MDELFENPESETCELTFSTLFATILPGKTPETNGGGADAANDTVTGSSTGRVAVFTKNIESDICGRRRRIQQGKTCVVGTVRDDK